jgi:hypothetical protein
MGAWGEGLLRDRTKAGNWLDKHGITQGELSKWSGLGRNTISRMCSDQKYNVTPLTKRTVIAALQVKGYSVEEYNLW